MNNNSWNKLTPIHYAWEEHKNTFHKQFCASEETEVTSTQNSPLRTLVLDHVPTKGIWRKKVEGEMRDRALQRCFYPQWKSEVRTWFLTAWTVRSVLFTVIPHATVIIEWELFPSPPWYFKCLFFWHFTSLKLCNNSYDIEADIKTATTLCFVPLLYFVCHSAK